MRRGYSLEQHINKLVDYVNQNGGHAHKNHPARTNDGKYLEGEAFDYEIFHKKTLLCFDAKESMSVGWKLDNAKLTQVKHLKNCKNNGTQAFFLVYFYPSQQLIKFDVDIVIKALQDGKKTLSAEEGEVFKYDF